jgi:type III pantothenate kinase
LLNFFSAAIGRGAFAGYLYTMKPDAFSLIVDAGNTRVKCALFRGTEVQEIRVFGREELAGLKNYLQQYGHIPAIIASVLSDKETRWLRQLHSKALLFGPDMKLPIDIAYETPQTLGADRLCNAIAAYHRFGAAVLAVDLGTCIKYDLTDETGTYLGGGISPGLQMRFKAMHTFTGKLPLIDDVNAIGLIGKNTTDAMRSGVINGIHAELTGIIAGYRNLFPGLPVILTGGDAAHFDLSGINGIFADENLTLRGLQTTLAKHDA